MADTLAMADEKGGYCLSDRGTWLAKKADFPDMDIVCEGSKELLNQYGVIAVNPEKYPDVNNEAAKRCSPFMMTAKRAQRRPWPLRSTSVLNTRCRCIVASISASSTLAAFMVSILTTRPCSQPPSARSTPSKFRSIPRLGNRLLSWCRPQPEGKTLQLLRWFRPYSRQGQQAVHSTQQPQCQRQLRYDLPALINTVSPYRG